MYQEIMLLVGFRTALEKRLPTRERYEYLVINRSSLIKRTKFAGNLIVRFLRIPIVR